jgi:hypothetical protein
VLALRKQTLMNQTLIKQTGQIREALVPKLTAEVLTGEADGTRARGKKWTSSGHTKGTSTPALLAEYGWDQVVAREGAWIQGRNSSTADE